MWYGEVWGKPNDQGKRTKINKCKDAENVHQHCVAKFPKTLAA